MIQRDVVRRGCASWFAVLLAAFAASPGFARPAQGASPAELAARAGVGGGLCVQVGCDDLAVAVELARSGRFLVQVLDRDAARVEHAREQLHAQGAYGLVSVDRIGSPARLPYAENLVNLLIVRAQAEAGAAEAGEAARVVAPGGLVIQPKTQDAEAALRAAGWAEVQTVESWLIGRKPWPSAMDAWTHARHGADGNAVSRDTLAGPPRRVRWVAGPWRENSRMVSDAGRNFYADVLARDAFNGLLLWERPLKASGPAIPVASPDRLFAVAEKKLVALSAATGQTVREYPEAGTPNDLMLAEGVLIAVDAKSVRAVEADSGRLRWQYEAPEPRYTVAGDGAVYLMKGSIRLGQAPIAVCLDLASGQVRWQQEYPWAAKTRRMVYHGGLLVHEVSTLTDDKPGNAIHVISAADGKLLWSREFVPGMNHRKQARAMFVGEVLWVLEHRKCVALDPKTGAARKDYPAGLCHCFPPVATPRYMLTGEMELTDLATGVLDANRITKAHCSGDFGWVPANGLIYVCPKHCVCWPMLRGYAAMAPALPGGRGETSAGEAAVVVEQGVEAPAAAAGEDAAADWPCYRHDPWRSGSTPDALGWPLKPAWRARLGAWPAGTIADDWRENPFVRGPVSAPVVAGGKVFVARPDAHQLVALDARTGEVRWRYTANGRVDTPPTIHRGLCLFGTKSGWVYCLRADDGRLVWRLRAAPSEERIVAYGQVESPWPVPGSVLVVDDVAYFAAGRQPLADGGIRVFAVEPATGTIRWQTRLDSLPMTDFYASIGLEFDNFDLLQQEGDAVSMSRWLFDRATGRMTCKAGEPFLIAATGGAGVWAPRGAWTYAPRHQPRHRRETRWRGLVAFRDQTLFGCLDDGRAVYRRDFHLEQGEKFDPMWMTGWAAGENANKGKGEYWLSQRLAQTAAWTIPLYAAEPNQRVAAMLLAGDRVFAAGSEGGLLVLSAKDGTVAARAELDKPVWDGMAAAGGRLFVSTQDGDVVCLAVP